MSQEPDALVDPDIAKEDLARTETSLPIGADALFAFISDLERLFRLNPHLDIETWQQIPGGTCFAAFNEATGRSIETFMKVEMAPERRAIVLNYADGLKKATTLAVEDGDGHSCRLVVTEYYPIIEDAQDSRVAEVDRSLVPWTHAIRRHLLSRRRWGWLPGWRWWNEHVLPAMAPRQRRIVRMIIWVGVLEFVIFLFVAVILWLERQSS